MRVLVTGSTGFVGLHTVLALLRSGHQVRLGVRDPAKMRRVFEPFGVGELEHVEGSITDEQAVRRALEGCDGVVHAAALVNLDARQADVVRRTNIRGTELVVGGAVERGIESIVYVSSIAALYRQNQGRLDERSPLGHSSSGYGQSKVESEKFVRRLQDAGAKVAITYPTSILGPDDPSFTEPNRGLAHFLEFMLYETTSGYQMVDVRDLAAVHARLIERGDSGRYVVGGHYRSWRDLADLIEEITARKLRRVDAPRWMVQVAGELGDLFKRFVAFDLPVTREGVTYATDWVYADSSHLERELDFRFRALRETLEDTIRWLARAGHVHEKWAEKLPPA
jgi:dihydroflavonol-4-reductase